MVRVGVTARVRPSVVLEGVSSDSSRSLSFGVRVRSRDRYGWGFGVRVGVFFQLMVMLCC